MTLFSILIYKDQEVEVVGIDSNTTAGVIFKEAKNYCMKLLGTAEKDSKTMNSVLQHFKFLTLREEDLTNQNLFHNFTSDLVKLLKSDNIVVNKHDQEPLIKLFNENFPQELYILPPNATLYGVTFNTGHMAIPKQHLERPKDQSIVLVSWILLHEFCHWLKNRYQRIPFGWKTPEFIKKAQTGETGEILQEKCFYISLSPKRLVENEEIYKCLLNPETLDDEMWNKIRTLALDDNEYVCSSENSSERALSIYQPKRIRMKKLGLPTKGYISPFNGGKLN